MIKDAYDVRCKYAHGSSNSDKNKQKYEQRYGSLDEFRNTVIDLLRVSILLFMLHKKNKDQIIIDLDNSMLSLDEDTKIREEISNIGLSL